MGFHARKRDNRLGKKVLVRAARRRKAQTREGGVKRKTACRKKTFSTSCGFREKKQGKENDRASRLEGKKEESPQKRDRDYKLGRNKGVTPNDFLVQEMLLEAPLSQKETRSRESE